MKKATTLIKKKQKMLFYSCVASSAIGCAILFIGGLSYVNPKLEFGALFKLEPLQNLIYSIIPEFK